MPMALEVRGLSVRHGTRTVVDGLDLELAEGRILALLGPNGAGKTTTIEAIVGLRPFVTGEIRIAGERPGRAIARSRVGVMLQHGGPYPSARPAQWIGYLGRLHGLRIDAAAVLERVGLQPGRRVQVRRMSGGEQQRLKLAGAMIANPPLLILDEPTAGLDASGRADLLEAVGELRRAGRSILMTTHRLDDVESLADDVVVLAEGRVAISGSPGELTGVGAGVRFRAVPGLPIGELVDLLADVGARVSAHEVTPGAYVITGAISPTQVARLVSWCADLGVIPEELRTDQRDLDDVIRAATRPQDAG